MKKITIDDLEKRDGDCSRVHCHECQLHETQEHKRVSNCKCKAIIWTMKKFNISGDDAFEHELFNSEENSYKVILNYIEMLHKKEKLLERLVK